MTTITLNKSIGANRNDLAYWWPILERTATDAGLQAHLPRTTIVRVEESLDPVLDGKPYEPFLRLVRALQDAASSYGYPCFLRTGHGSGKHEWERTCYVPSADAMAAHVAALIEWSACVDFVGLPTDTWVVREWLHLQTSFRAFSGRMPINKERRYFFDERGIVCHHPYWPPAAVADGDPERPDWREALDALNRETLSERTILGVLTGKLSKPFDGAWCMDWAQDNRGRWYVIDMALAKDAFHWKGCPERKHFRDDVDEEERPPVDYDALLVPVGKGESDAEE